MVEQQNKATVFNEIRELDAESKVGNSSQSDCFTKGGEITPRSRHFITRKKVDGEKTRLTSPPGLWHRPGKEKRKGKSQSARGTWSPQNTPAGVRKHFPHGGDPGIHRLKQGNSGVSNVKNRKKRERASTRGLLAFPIRERPASAGCIVMVSKIIQPKTQGLNRLSAETGTPGGGVRKLSRKPIAVPDVKELDNRWKKINVT